MARPRKLTVDYFPHYCQHKKTMFILEQRYGNDGYAFWFKLLELLGSTDNHYLDLNDDTMWEFLQAKTRLSHDLCTEILNLLAKLDAIDGELWAVKIVWSDNFMEGIEPVYANRRGKMPTRPSFYIDKPEPDGVSTDRNTQTRVDYSIVDHHHSSTKYYSSTGDNKNEKNDDDEKNNDGTTVNDVVDFFLNNISPTASPFQIEKLTKWMDEDGLDPDLVLYAIERALTADVRKLNYIEAILKNYVKGNIKTRKQAESQDNARKTKLNTFARDPTGLSDADIAHINATLPRHLGGDIGA